MKKRSFRIMYVIITAIFMVCMNTSLARADDNTTSDGLTYTTSNSCAARATTLTPVAGAANQITLTVKDSAGNTDTSFNGSYRVGLSGLKVAPNGGYGKITYNNSQTGELSSTSAPSINFDAGTASFSLELDDAENQSIEFNIDGVTAPYTNTLNIKPINGDAAQMVITTQPLPGTGSLSGDAFQTQPAVTLKDQYGNVCLSGSSASATVTAAPKSGTAGSWNITGTRSQSARSGNAVFTDLGCSVLNPGGGAITFTSGSLSVNSDSFALPALKDAKALTAGSDNDMDHDIAITFTPDQVFEDSITGVSFGVSSLTPSQYEIHSGEVILKSGSGAIDVPSGVWRAVGYVVITATNYHDSTVQLTIYGSHHCDVTAVTQPASSTIDSTNHTITANLTSSANSTPVEVTTSPKSTWKLYSDSNCTSGSEISNKIMTLTPGHNTTAYIQVTAQDGTSKKIYTLTINVPVSPNSTISPGTATFDKYAGSANNRDVSVSMTLNGNTLTGITNGSTPLTAGTDYTVTGPGNNTITLNINYLKRQNIGTTILTFNFSAGNSQNLLITVVDNTPQYSGGGAINIPYFTISGAQCDGGTIAFSSSSVTAGGSVTVTITPDIGYAVSDVLVNGVSVGAVTSYTIQDVTKNVTVSAAFSKAKVPEWTNPYSDVQDSVWYYNAVKYVSEKGLMQGDNGTFSPTIDMTRGMFVTILNRMSGSSGSFANPFNDVPSDAYYENAAAWAYNNGIISGTGAGIFSPDTPLIREQLAVMLYNFAKFNGYDVAEGANTGLDSFRDGNNVSAYAEPAMRWAFAVGILKGDSAGMLTPQGAATRAEVAEMLLRFGAVVKG